MTHALAALLRGDIGQYWRTQPLALPLVLSVLLCFHLRQLRGTARVCACVFVGATLTHNVARWLVTAIG